MPLFNYKVREKGQTDFEVFECWSPFEAATDFCRRSINPEDKTSHVASVEVALDCDEEDINWASLDIHFRGHDVVSLRYDA